MSLKNSIYKLRLKLLYLSNSIKYHLKKGKKLDIVSSRKYKNKRKEDLMLQKYLLKAGYHSKIVAWEDHESTGNCIIRSVWGYHNNSKGFIKYLEENKTINTKDIILNNMDKKKQYEILIDNKINTIKTLFINDISEYKYQDEKVVIKPVISASGNNTYIVEKEEDLKKLNGINNLMVQQYISGIKEGETSVIVIDKNIMYGIKRFPGVFTEYKKEEFIPLDKLNQDIIDTVNKIIKIEDYKDAVFMRIDFVKDNDKYLVMEVELVDPDLFIETIPDKNEREKVYKKFVASINKFLNN